VIVRGPFSGETPGKSWKRIAPVFQASAASCRSLQTGFGPDIRPAVRRIFRPGTRWIRLSFGLEEVFGNRGRFAGDWTRGDARGSCVPCGCLRLERHPYFFFACFFPRPVAWKESLAIWPPP